jgi:hypothetical protein
LCFSASTLFAIELSYETGAFTGPAQDEGGWEAEKIVVLRFVPEKTGLASWADLSLKTSKASLAVAK